MEDRIDPGIDGQTPVRRPSSRRKPAASVPTEDVAAPDARPRKTGGTAAAARKTDGTASRTKINGTTPASRETASTAGSPAKRPPRKVTAEPAPSRDEPTDDTLLADLDLILADLDRPAPREAPSFTAPEPQPSVAPAAAESRAAGSPVASRTIADPAPSRARLATDPAFVAEHVAREAVRRLGPDARQWVAGMRERYPLARPDALAKLAVEEHIRTARRHAMTNTTAFGAWADLGLLGRTHASLVLTVAAVFDVDPTSDARTWDLLKLLPTSRLTQPSLAAVGSLGHVLGAVALRRIAARLVPFGAAVAGMIHSGRTTQDVGMRAIDRFRPPR